MKINFRSAYCLLLSSLITLTAACSDITRELTGSARPDAEVAEQLPPTKNFNAPFDKTWKAALNVFDNNGILYEADKTNGKIVTEDKSLQNISGWRAMFAGSNYKAKQFIDVKKTADNQTSVKFSARFTKEFMTILPTTNKEYPEAENMLRKTFFEELDQQLASLPPSVPQKISSKDIGNFCKAIKTCNVRSDPSTKKVPMAQLQAGDTAEKIGQQDDWIKIRLDDGREGWVNKTLVE
jgi:hypothetical protein